MASIAAIGARGAVRGVVRVASAAMVERKPYHSDLAIKECKRQKTSSYISYTTGLFRRNWWELSNALSLCTGQNLIRVRKFSNLVRMIGTRKEENIMVERSKKVLSTWGEAVVATDYDAILKQYHTESVLVPTLSNDIRKTADEKLDYFEGFASRVTAIKWYWDTMIWQDHDGIMTVSGAYDFTLNDGTTSRAQFVMTVGETEDGEEKIFTHMSRLLPMELNS